ncbi:MAG: HK97 family phage prohead protease [Alphaproteobacteria bacterium]|jgi:HK97 family phage prohead protease
MQKKQFDYALSLKNLDENGTFTGYASIFNIKDYHSDIILKGAFKKTLSKKKIKDIKLLWQHKLDEPIGYFTNIQENAEGLFVEGKLLINDLQRAKEAYALLQVNAIEGLSIGYNVVESHYDNDQKARVINQLELFEISLVTFPANQMAGVTDIKNSLPQTVRQFEQFLRDAGFSKKSATFIASFGFKETKRDALPEAQTQEVDDFVKLDCSLQRAIEILKN